MLPFWCTCRRSRPLACQSTGWVNTAWILHSPSLRLSISFSNRTLPLCSSPIWSHRSSSSRRLWLVITTVICRSAICWAISFLTKRRITGSNPSKASSSKRYRGQQLKAAISAAWRRMPLEKVFSRLLVSRGNRALSWAQSSSENPEYIPL